MRIGNIRLHRIPRISKNVLMIVMAVLFVIYGLYFNYALTNIYGSFIAEEYKNWKFSLNVLCDEAEYFRPGAQHLDSLRRAVTAIDASAGTFAAMYDSELRIITDRTPVIETEFKPMEYPELVKRIRAAKRGETTIWFDEPGVEPHSLHVYFRWVDDALVVIGVSKVTVDASIDANVMSSAMRLLVASVACFALMVVSMAAEEWGKRHAGTARMDPVS